MFGFSFSKLLSSGPCFPSSRKAQPATYHMAGSFLCSRSACHLSSLPQQPCGQWPPSPFSLQIRYCLESRPTLPGLGCSDRFCLCCLVICLSPFPPHKLQEGSGPSVLSLPYPRYLLAPDGFDDDLNWTEGIARHRIEMYSWSPVRAVACLLCVRR